MILQEGGKINIHGAITINNVVEMTAQGIALINNGNRLVIDLEKVDEVDSSIISMLLEWLREANRLDCQLHFVNMSESLKSLIKLYGVADFFSFDQNDQPINPGSIGLKVS